MSVYALPLDSSGIAPGGESRGSFFVSVNNPIHFLTNLVRNCNMISGKRLDRLHPPASVPALPRTVCPT